MFILEDFESEVRDVQYINLIVLVEESTFAHSPVGCSGGWQVCCRDGVEVYVGTDVVMEFLNIH